MDISGSTFSFNSATVNGGAISTAFTTNIFSSVFTDNTASSNGGAIYNASAGTITFTGTNTFSGNTAGGVLNDIYNDGTIAVEGVLTLDGGITGTGNTHFVSGSTLSINKNTSLTQNNIVVYDGAKLALAGSAGTVSFKNLIFDADAVAWGYDSVNDTYDKATLNAGYFTVDSLSYTDKIYTIVTSVDSAAVGEALGSSASAASKKLAIAALGSGNEQIATFMTGILNENKSAEVIENIAQGTTSGAVVPGLSSVSSAASANMGSRTSVAPTRTAASETSTWLAMNGDGAILPAADGGNMAKGFGIWLMPMYQHTSADGFSTGNGTYGYDTNIFGVTLGADYTFAGDVRLGLALNVGEGSSTSSGSGAASSENDFDYFGVSVYGAKHFVDFGLSFDMGYTISENAMEQGYNDTKLYGDVDAVMFTMGVKGEYLVALDGFNVTPYLGARFSYFDVDSYKTKFNDGSILFHNDSAHSVLWEIPVGVNFDTTMQVGSWNVSPSLGLGVKFAMGDLDAEQSVSIDGVAGKSIFSSEVADDVTFQGALGLAFTKELCTLSVNYTLDASENVESHGVSLNLRYDF